MIDIEKIMEYNRYLRHQYLETLATLPWDAVIEDRAASFNSIRNIFLHCIGVLDWIVNRILQGGDPSFPRVNFDDYDSIEKVRKYVERVESEGDEYLSGISPAELSRKVDRAQRDGTILTATVEDYLVHLFQEETHHRGELIALLWQQDVRPSHMGWLQYLNQIVN